MTIGGKFFEELRELILRQEEYTERLIPHYENLLDYHDSLATMLVDVEDNEFHVLYDKDNTGGYTDGELVVSLFETNRYYKIKLLVEDRMTGYCMCDESVEGYNKEHKCTGVLCDWYAPSFEVELVTSIAHGSFDGYQYQMWEKEKKWDEYSKERKERKTKEKIGSKLNYAKQYMEQARELQKEAEELMKELEQGE